MKPIVLTFSLPSTHVHRRAIVQAVEGMAADGVLLITHDHRNEFEVKIPDTLLFRFAGRVMEIQRRLTLEREGVG